MTTETMPATVEDRDHKRQVALLKAVGLDRVAPEQRELALAIAKRYDLDLMLKHLVLIDGRPYITRDGLLHVAHRSGQLDGIEVTRPIVEDKFWISEVAVYRKDMSRPFRYVGRYPIDGRNKAFAPEMATKVGEVMSLRRAFDVSAPSAEERWDADVPAVTEPEPPKTLAERVAQKAAEVSATPTDTAAPGPSVTPVEQEAAAIIAETFPDGGRADDAQASEQPNPEPADPPVDDNGEVQTKRERCPAMPPDNGMNMTQQCALFAEHKGYHKSREGSWPG